MTHKATKHKMKSPMAIFIKLNFEYQISFFQWLVLFIFAYKYETSLPTTKREKKYKRERLWELRASLYMLPAI